MINRGIPHALVTRVPIQEVYKAKKYTRVPTGDEVIREELAKPSAQQKAYKL
jgi:hypothetical protein